MKCEVSLNKTEVQNLIQADGGAVVVRLRFLSISAKLLERTIDWLKRTGRTQDSIQRFGDWLTGRE